ncbi:MAG: acylneuraminate cytidylyltransferase family protein [Thaumarchaeota archaeon]|nr:MAG: acylneuraminate cytidylyltransferase family protein [Nitrososphaerota archaeon]
MTIVAIITARSGSKSVPNKNIRKLGGIPLLGWVVKALNKSKFVEKIILSTDSEEYFKIAKSFNGEIILHKRTPELAEDVPSEQVLLDVAKKFETLFDEESIIVLIQPTTPFITGKDIDSCIDMLIKNPEINSCISVKQVSEYPEWMITQIDDRKDIGTCIDLSGDVNVRQNLKKRWISNGGIWVVRRSFLQKMKKIVDNNSTLVYEMSKLRSIDIDENDDLIICDALVNSGILLEDCQVFLGNRFKETTNLKTNIILITYERKKKKLEKTKDSK